MPQRQSYLICSVQRAGSWLLCHALQDTGVLGVPAEYFHRGDELFWRGQWKTATEDGFLQALRERPTSANGVWGSKMMWNYFGDALGRLRAWPRLDLGPDAADPVVRRVAAGEPAADRADRARLISVISAHRLVAISPVFGSGRRGRGR